MATLQAAADSNIYKDKQTNNLPCLEAWRYRVPLGKGHRQGGVWKLGANGRNHSAYDTFPYQRKDILQHSFETGTFFHATP